MKFDEPVENKLRISKVNELVYNAFRGFSLTEKPRPYIGASIAGHHCDRYIWLNFHWAFYYQKPNEGRMELLFKRGQREEEYVKYNLEAIGLEPKYMLFQQLDIYYGCHVAGHPDGIIPSGVYEAPKAAHNLEIKTHNDRSFKELVRLGVREAKPQHYIQMQLEMYGEKFIHQEYDVNRSLYYAVNKNDDSIYTERIALDKALAEKVIKHCQNLALEPKLPKKCSENPDFFKCKFCDFYGFCHSDDLLCEVNCRTCAHSTAQEDGTFFCELYKDTIPLKAQYIGCPSHAFHPDLVKWRIISEKCTDWSACYVIPELGEVLNGFEGTSSEEISRRILEIRRKDASYLDFKNQAPTVPDPNDIIPF